MLLKLRFVADSIPSALTTLTPCKPSVFAVFEVFSLFYPSHRQSQKVTLRVERAWYALPEYLFLLTIVPGKTNIRAAFGGHSFWSTTVCVPVSMVFFASVMWAPSSVKSRTRIG
jgi:hypothetical protein